MLRTRRTRLTLLAVLCAIAAGIVVHHPAPVAPHGDDHHHAVAEMLLCLALAGAALMTAAACTRTLDGPPVLRATSERLPDLCPPAAPRPRARAGPPGLAPVLRT